MLFKYHLSWCYWY